MLPKRPLVYHGSNIKKSVNFFISNSLGFSSSIVACTISTTWHKTIASALVSLFRGMWYVVCVLMRVCARVIFLSHYFLFSLVSLVLSSFFYLNYIEAKKFGPIYTEQLDKYG